MAKMSSGAAFRDLSGPVSASEKRQGPKSARRIPFHKSSCGFLAAEYPVGTRMVLKVKDRKTGLAVSCAVGEFSESELCGQLRDKIREIPTFHNPLPWKR